MVEEWFYVADGVQGGPVGVDALAGLVARGALTPDTLVWKEGMADWRPARQALPELFAPRPSTATPPTVLFEPARPARAPAPPSAGEATIVSRPVTPARPEPAPAPPPAHGDWFYLAGDAQKGPVAIVRLQELGRTGAVDRATLVWKEGLPEWKAAGELPELAALLPASPPPLPGRSGPPPPPKAAGPRRGILAGIGAKISEVTDLPTISNVPIRDILIGGVGQAAKAKEEDVEDEFTVGTARTTPPLSQVETGWPSVRIAWRVLAASLLVYGALRFGIAQWHNSNFIPGMAFVGSFVVPFSIVILFFELNTPRNVSIYQVVKMTALGGAVSLLSTMIVLEFVTGSGAGDFVPAMLTGFAEELGKALALLLIVWNPRYRWQLNGLLFGAAVGAGFAGFESAGYAFNRGYDSFMTALGGVLQGKYTVQAAFEYSLQEAISNITMRGMLAPGGHVIWTAMVGSAIWKVKNGRPFEVGMLFDKTVVRRFLAAVVLHGLWDTIKPLVPRDLQLGALIVVGWYIIFAILKDAFAEVEKAKTSGEATQIPVSA
jgi:RsiW-degrading membrane proteinase PrsW (M82 family)